MARSRRCLRARPRCTSTSCGTPASTTCPTRSWRKAARWKRSAAPRAREADYKPAPSCKHQFPGLAPRVPAPERDSGGSALKRRLDVQLAVTHLDGVALLVRQAVEQSCEDGGRLIAYDCWMDRPAGYFLTLCACEHD